MATALERILAYRAKLERREADTKAQWRKHLVPLTDRPIQYLEIGVYAGDSMVWMLDNVLTHPESKAIGIDPWEEWGQRRMRRVWRTAKAVVRPYRRRGRASLIRGLSADVLRREDFRDRRFDLIYIDGDHKTLAVLEDSLLVWPLLRQGGIMIWDDYVKMKPTAKVGVQRAVDAFLGCVVRQHELLWRTWTVGVRRTSPDGRGG